MGGVCLGSQRCQVVKNAKEGEPQAGQDVFVSPSNKLSHWLFYWAKVGATGLTAGEPSHAQTLHTMLRRHPHVPNLNPARQSLIIIFKLLNAVM